MKYLQEQNKALETRPFRMKNPVLRFFCALCRSERELTRRSKLSGFQVLQILLISSIAVLISFPFFGVKSLVLIPIVWAIFEGIHKINFRKEIPCPYCGFDATWYKKDVKVARRNVEEFWHSEEPLLEEPASLSQ